jgi:hypothetical protein
MKLRVPATFTVTVTEPVIALSVVATLDKNANCNGCDKLALLPLMLEDTPYAFALASAGLPAAGAYTAQTQQY